ncbi:MAG: hypothetical protein ACPGU7_12130 [Gammaproteobacteria bacterium]
MKWRKKIWVFDDIVPRDHQEHIRKTLLGNAFNWKFVEDVTGGGSRDKRPAFSHTFIRDGVVQTHERNIRLLQPMWLACMEKINEKAGHKGEYAAVQSRTFLQLPLANLRGSEYDAHHIDLMDEHFAILYYVCDADGDTVLFENMYSKASPHAPAPGELREKKRVRPKQGRAVVFDGYYWHTATQPRKSNRCVINTDVIQMS